MRKTHIRNMNLAGALLFVCGSAIAGSNFSFVSIQENKENVAPKDTLVLNYLANEILSNLSKPESFRKVYDNVEKATKIIKAGKTDIPPLIHLAFAEYYLAINNYQKASEEGSAAFKSSKNQGDITINARTILFLGKYCLKTGQFQQGIENFSNAVKVAEKFSVKGILPAAYEGLASLYGALNKSEDYERSLNQMIFAAQSENDPGKAVTGYFRLGTLRTQTKRDFRLADSILKKGSELARSIQDTLNTARILTNIGWNFYLEKLYDSSLFYYSKSLEYSLPAKIFGNSANAYGNMGTIYRNMRMPDKAADYYKKGIDMSVKGRDWVTISWIYEDMSNMYLGMSDTSKAYVAFVLFKQYSDSTATKSSLSRLNEARIQYEADSRQKEMELLSLRLKNQVLLIYGFAGFFLLTLIIAVLGFRQSKINARRRISEMNRKISEITQANLRQQMNPHFIFNTLNSIQYYMYQHDKLATNNYLTKFASLMRRILENSQHTSISIQDELDALRLYLELEQIRFKDKFDYTLVVDEEIDPLLYKVPTMLIQPYIENAICHGLMPRSEKGSLRIELKLENDYINCTIEDNGIGREAAQEIKKKNEDNHNSLGTRIASTRLDLVNALYGTSLKTIYTDLKDIEGKPVGTRVEIHIPIII